MIDDKRKTKWPCFPEKSKRKVVFESQFDVAYKPLKGIDSSKLSSNPWYEQLKETFSIVFEPIEFRESDFVVKALAWNSILILKDGWIISDQYLSC